MKTLDPKTRVLTWRADIVAEIKKAQKALPALQAAHETAIAEAEAIRHDYRDLQHFLTALAERLSPQLAIRSESDRSEIEPAKTRQARALADLELARSQITEWERAVAQIDRLTIPADTEEAA